MSMVFRSGEYTGEVQLDRVIISLDPVRHKSCMVVANIVDNAETILLVVLYQSIQEAQDDLSVKTLRDLKVQLTHNLQVASSSARNLAGGFVAVLHERRLNWLSKSLEATREHQS